MRMLHRYVNSYWGRMFCNCSTSSARTFLFLEQAKRASERLNPLGSGSNTGALWLFSLSSLYCTTDLHCYVYTRSPAFSSKAAWCMGGQNLPTYNQTDSQSNRQAASFAPEIPSP